MSVIISGELQIAPSSVVKSTTERTAGRYIFKTTTNISVTGYRPGNTTSSTVNNWSNQQQDFQALLKQEISTMLQLMNNKTNLVSYNCTNSTSITSPTKASSYFNKIKLDLSAVLPVYFIVLVACLIGNITVCVTVLRSKEMRRKRWYYFLMNLSVADVGLALTTLSHLLQLQGVDVGKDPIQFHFQFSSSIFRVQLYIIV